MGGLFSPSVPAVPPAPKPPERDDPAAEEARRKEIIRARNVKGRQASMLTGGAGIEAAAPVARKTLLGE